MGCLCCCLPRRYSLNEENLLTSERDMLELSLMLDNEINSIFVKCGTFNGEPIYMRTVMFGQKANPTIVFLHGYGSASPLFFKLYKHLSKRFFCIFIDMVGMGSSSRPQNYDKNTISPEDSTEYFLNYLEAWRIEMAKVLEVDEFKDFYLLGHSFGGWLAGNYMVKYHQNVKKAILLSPIGLKPLSDFDPNWVQQFENDRGTGPPRFLRYCQCFATWAWNRKISPFQLYRGAGKWISMQGIKGFLKRRKYVSNAVHLQICQNYMYQVFMRPGTTEYALFVEFRVGLQAHYPLTLESKLCQPGFPKAISFIYGELDWTPQLDKDAYQSIIDANSQKSQCKRYILPRADHNMHMDNPEELAEIIIQDLLGPDSENKMDFAAVDTAENL